jgi:NAD+ kinase
MANPRVIVVAKRSLYSRAVEGEGDPRARELLRRGDPSVKRWVLAHDAHMTTLAAVEKALHRLGAQTLILRGAHAAFDPRGSSLVVSVGGDGTLLAASHNIFDVPLLGVNSSPRFSVGFFCAAQKQGILKALGGALDGSMPSVRLTRMTVSQNGQVRSQRVLNEALYSHSEPAATSHYILQRGQRKEVQRSSGLWIGPAAGSTGAQRSAGGKLLPLTSKKLQVVAREIYKARGERYRLTCFSVGPNEKVSVKSKMHRAGVYLDGPYLQFGVRLGDVTTFELSDQPLTVLGLDKHRRWP